VCEHKFEAHPPHLKNIPLSLFLTRLLDDAEFLNYASLWWCRTANLLNVQAFDAVTGCHHFLAAWLG
jgi:hypothetical protein